MASASSATTHAPGGLLGPQISVYNHDGGPCYRCVHPEPPPQMAVTSCADGGVLGPVPGLMGCWQAIEAIKVLAGVGKPMVSKCVGPPGSPSLRLCPLT